MADLISREALLSELEERFENHQKRSQRNVGAGFAEIHKEWAAMAMGVSESLAVIRIAPAVDAVEVDFIAKWLAEIAMNNFGYPVEDMAAACVEIIKRLDGLRKFAEEKREEQ